MNLSSFNSFVFKINCTGMQPVHIKKKRFRFQPRLVFGSDIINNNKGINQTIKLVDYEKMRNIMSSSLKELQFILTLKQEEDFSQNELCRSCQNGSPLLAFYIWKHKPCHKQ